MIPRPPRSTLERASAASDVYKRQGDNIVSPRGHLEMMAAVQPFLSGAISKTVNTPETTTVDEIEQIYIDGWRLGLKAVAIYRDNCKRRVLI